MLLWIIVGVAIGYFFKPQIDRVVYRIIRTIRDNRRNN